MVFFCFLQDCQLILTWHQPQWSYVRSSQTIQMLVRFCRVPWLNICIYYTLAWLNWNETCVCFMWHTRMVWSCKPSRFLLYNVIMYINPSITFQSDNPMSKVNLRYRNCFFNLQARHCLLTGSCCHKEESLIIDGLLKWWIPLFLDLMHGDTAELHGNDMSFMPSRFVKTPWSSKTSCAIHSYP